MERSDDTRGADPRRTMLRPSRAAGIRMPSLREAVRRLDEPAPAELDPDAYAILREVWRTYPRAAAEWQEVIPPDQPTPERWLALGDGSPLLDETMIRWESPPLRRQHGRLLRLFRSPDFTRLEALRDLRRELGKQSCAPADWAREYFRSAADAPQPQTLLGGYIVQPFLYAFARRVQAGLRERTWERTRCPVCGGQPYHGYLHPRTRRKVLVCGKCQCPWVAPRLQCPFCANTDQDSLGYFYEEDAAHLRVDYCTSCRRVLPISPCPESHCPFPLVDHLVAMPLLGAVGRRRTDA